MAGVRIRPRRLVLVGSVVVDVLLFVDRLPDRGGDLLARQAVATAGGGFNVLGDAVYVSGYDLVYPVSGQSLQQWLPGLAEDLLVAIDPGPLVADIPAERLERVLGRSDLLSLSAGEAATLSGLQDPASAAARLVGRLAAGALVVVRTGASGCWLAAAGAEPLHLPGRPARVVDTTGAGDAHLAAFVARLSLGEDPVRAARGANVAASLTVERAGPGTGPTAAELQAALEEH
jgi:sugar/nucleoside kinase (ribokinase family)